MLVGGECVYMSMDECFGECMLMTQCMSAFVSVGVRESCVCRGPLSWRYHCKWSGFTIAGHGVPGPLLEMGWTQALLDPFSGQILWTRGPRGAGCIL